MNRYWVTYSEHRIMEVVVEAENEDEAKALVMEGGADYVSANELDAEVTSVNSVTFVDGEGNEDS